MAGSIRGAPQGRRRTTPITGRTTECNRRFPAAQRQASAVRGRVPGNARAVGTRTTFQITLRPRVGCMRCWATRHDEGRPEGSGTTPAHRDTLACQFRACYIGKCIRGSGLVRCRAGMTICGMVVPLCARPGCAEAGAVRSCNVPCSGRCAMSADQRTRKIFPMNSEGDQKTGFVVS